MSGRVRIRLVPLGHVVEVEPGASLQDVLFEHGVEFPCGGRGRCRGCRVKVLEGSIPVGPQDAKLLGADAVAQGWRLACRAVAGEDLVLELGQWDAPILSDQSAFEFEPREGVGIAFDLGTTTVVGQIVDLATGCVLAVESGLNRQARFGADVMSRVERAVAEGPGGELTLVIRSQLGEMIERLLIESGRVREDLGRVTVVGNTAMHHLFCGLDLGPLSQYPFETSEAGLRLFSAGDLGWALPERVVVAFLPCLGGFVGSDILAGVLATGLHRAGCAVLIDLGTNGEIVVSRSGELLCASTAAGPAFEGARISCGMRAASGAVVRVAISAGAMRCAVIGSGEPRGVCGSGLVDAAACALDLGMILPGGRIVGGHPLLPLGGAVSLTQGDIRELQLAKGAIAAGIELLLARIGADPSELEAIYLAGAFGNYIGLESARRIGLLPFAPERVTAAGNTALLGAKMALFVEDLAFAGIVARTEHMSLSADPRFEDCYIDNMGFPE